MKILILEPKRAPRVAELTGGIKEMQAIVGGCIQAIYPFPERVALICNDNGKLLGQPLNRGLRDEDGNLSDIVCGTFFLCGAPPDSDSFSSLTPEQLDHFQQLFRTPETFLRINGKPVCLPMTTDSM